MYSSPSGLASPLSPVGSTFPTGCWDGKVEENSWRVPCQSLYVGYEILKYSLGCNIWINRMTICHSGFESVPYSEYRASQRRVPKGLNPHDKQRCNIRISWPQHAVKVSLRGKGPVLSLDCLQLLYNKLGTTIPLGLLVAQRHFIELGDWYLGDWELPWGRCHSTVGA